MKSLHWSIVAIVIMVMIGLPVWYSLAGAGADNVPGEQSASLRAGGGRLITGGGPRLGK